MTIKRTTTKAAKVTSNAAAKKADPVPIQLLKAAVEESKDESPAQVDSHVPGGELAYEVVKISGMVCSVYLMKSDLRNNNNKYYIVQML